MPSFRRLVISLTLGWLAVMVLAPHLLVLVTSFMSSDTQHLAVWPLSLEGYAKVFQPIYFDVFLHSLWLSAAATALCLLIGYPFAFILARQKPVWRNVLLVLMMLPFWTNSLIRTYAIKIILGKKGLVNTLLLGAGIVDEPLSLLYTEFAVIFGLVYILLPFMVLPLMASFEQLSREYVEAARDLRANAWQRFRHIYLPLTSPGIVAGHGHVLRGRPARRRHQPAAWQRHQEPVPGGSRLAFRFGLQHHAHRDDGADARGLLPGQPPGAAQGGAR